MILLIYKKNSQFKGKQLYLNFKEKLEEMYLLESNLKKNLWPKLKRKKNFWQKFLGKT
jgi:hypothetical protein